MKTTRRRNVASLTFIAFLAAVYAVILLVGRPGGSSDRVPAEAGDATETAVNNPNAGAASSDTVAQSDKPVRKKKKQNRTTGNSTKSGRHAAPDNPDVFDRPVTPAVP